MLDNHDDNGSVVTDRTGPVDQYFVRVLTSSLVGNIHMSIYLSQLSGDEPVRDAKIQVTGLGPTDASRVVGTVTESGAFTDPNWYGVNLFIEEPGAWSFTLTADSSLGKATVDFPVNLQQPGSINLFAIVALAMIVVIFGWSGYSWIQRKTRRPGPL